MPVNPITLEKMEPVVIRQIENKVIDRIVHEIKGAEIQNQNRKKKESFSREKQQKGAEKFSFFLLKFNIKFEYEIYNDKIKFKIKDKEGNLIIESETDDIESLIEGIKKSTGCIIDIKG